MLGDVTNPQPKTQLELRRVDVANKQAADGALREVARRLLGNAPGSAPLPEERSTNPAVWAQVSAYLCERIQAPGMPPHDRKPDMSAEATEAIKAVLREVGGNGSSAANGTADVTSAPPTSEFGGMVADMSSSLKKPGAKKKKGWGR